MAGASGRSISATQAPMTPGSVPVHLRDPRRRSSASLCRSVQPGDVHRRFIDRDAATGAVGGRLGVGRGVHRPTVRRAQWPPCQSPRSRPRAAPSVPSARSPRPGEEFRELARDRRVIPVTRRLLADALTPVGLYATLAGDRPGTFLLESAENGHSWSRWSFVGVSAPAALTERDGVAHWLGEPAGRAAHRR